METKINSEANYKILEEALTDSPPLFKETTLKNFWRMKFDSQEDFEEYVKETSEDLDKYSREKVEEDPK